MPDGARDRELILAAKRWPTNAELIADVAELGYLRPDRLTLDPTYENGIWWKDWRPDDGKLVTHHRLTDGSDFRSLPYGDGHFGQIGYDPPYVPMGGTETSTLADYNERFGRDTVANGTGGAEACQHLINDGLTEMWRLAAPDDGIVLVKCQDHIWNNELWLGVHWTATHAIALGFIIEEHLRMYDVTAGAQPHLSACLHCKVPLLRRADLTWQDRKRSGDGPSTTCRTGPNEGHPHEPDPDAPIQSHAAYSCLSTLLVCRKPKGRRTPQYRNFAPPHRPIADPTRLFPA